MTFRNHFIQESFFSFKPPDGNYSVRAVWDTLASWQRSDSSEEKTQIWPQQVDLCAVKCTFVRFSNVPLQRGGTTSTLIPNLALLTISCPCMLARTQTCTHAHISRSLWKELGQKLTREGGPFPISVWISAPPPLLCS